jgi:hypothetical protein
MNRPNEVIVSRRSRREFITTAAATMIAGLIPRWSRGAEATGGIVGAIRRATAVTTTPLRSGVSVIAGSGGNIGVVADSNGKVDHTIVIPGHGAIGSRESLTRYHRMLVTCRDRIRALKQKGLSLSEVVADRPTADYDAEFGGFLIKPDAFVGLVYAGV